MSLKRWAIITVLAAASVFALAFYLGRFQPVDMIYGVSFDVGYAQYLGLDYQEAFKTILDEWDFRYLRLNAHWDGTEPKPNEFSFAQLDWLMSEAAQRKVKVILAVGQKTPRWPECHAPDWTKALSEAEYYAALRNYIETVVKHYQNNPALEIWQVENEPFLGFGGKCRATSSERLEQEISWVNGLDKNHKILAADSGELSTWTRTARAGDYFGTTLYRTVWNRYIGYWSYDWLPAAFYRLKLWLNRQLAQNAFVVELQAEPWIPSQPFMETSIEEQSKSMDLARLQKNLQFAEQLGFSRVYFWGAEWWVWLKTQGRNDIPNYIKALPKDS